MAIHSSFFCLNLSQDCSISICCPGLQCAHHLLTRWIPFMTSHLRSWIFQQTSQSAGRCKKCPAMFLGRDNFDLPHSISLHVNQLLWKLMIVEGCDFDQGTSYISVWFWKLLAAKRKGWLLHMSWDLVSNRLKQILSDSQVAGFRILRWRVVRT